MKNGSRSILLQKVKDYISISIDLIYIESYVSNDENNNKNNPHPPNNRTRALQSLEHVGQGGPFFLKHKQIYFCILNRLPFKGGLSRRATK